MISRLELVEEILDCTSCELHAVGGGPVAFSAPTGATIVVVGEAPGRQEDVAGAPFVGPAGKLLREQLTLVGIDPEAVAYVNTVSCFPNATPALRHVQACSGLKEKQIAYVKPRWALLVGKVALQAIDPRLDIRHGRGRPFLSDGLPCFATYHPAAAMRNGKYLEQMQADLQMFARIVTRGIEYPDDCSGCGDLAEFWSERDWLGWCESHVPDADRPVFAQMRDSVLRDYQEAKEREGSRA